MIYTIVCRDTGRKYGLDANDIEAARRHVYWKEQGGRFDIYKGKKLMGTMMKGNFCWVYDPETGYRKEYYVLGNGSLRDVEWEG